MSAPKLAPDPGWMGDPRRGASMGRISYAEPSEEATGKLTLQRLRLNSEGYDSGGAYWGVGEPLYWCTNEGDIDMFFRAEDRDAAKAHVRELFPSAKFYR